MGSGTTVEVRGAENVARNAMAAAQLGLDARLALVNGAPGFVSLRDGDVFAVAALTVQNGRITTMDIPSTQPASPASTSQPSTPDDDGTRIDQIAPSRAWSPLKPIGRTCRKRQVLEPGLHRRC
jgi:hypothetical protein